MTTKNNYCTKGIGGRDRLTPCSNLKSVYNRKIVGEFVCDRVFCYTTSSVKDGADISDADMETKSCLSHEELSRYEYSAKAKENCVYMIGLYGWHISNLKVYDKPRELAEFVSGSSRLGLDLKHIGMERPPQS